MLSVITITRNNVKGIRATLESVVEQKTKEIEYLVIDGGSTDGTAEIIREYLDDIDVFVSEPDEGIYDAINKGISRAQGSIIGIMHSGDHFFPDILHRVIDVHRKFPDSILYGCMKMIRNGTFEEVMGWDHSNLTTKMIPHLASFVPAAVYSRYGCYDLRYKIAADYEAFLRYFLKGVPFRFLDLLVCDFNREGISETDPSTKTEVLKIHIRYGLRRREKPVERAVRNLKTCLSKILTSIS